MIKNTDVSEEPAASITTADKLLLIEAASSSDLLMYCTGLYQEERNLSA